MSITFRARHAADDDEGMNLSNGNAFALMEFVGVVPDYCGEIPAVRLAELCGRRLIRPADAPTSPEIPVTETGGEGRARLIDCGRRAGYLEERTQQLFELAKRAGADTVVWG